MALTTVNFTTSESLGTLSDVTFTDASQGSDNTLTIRKIYVRLANGNYLLQGGNQVSTRTAIDWSINDISTTIDLIRVSTTASVQVDWMNGSTIVYTKTLLQTWDLYDYIFALQLIAGQTAQPDIIQDQNYYSNFFMFITNIFNAETANTYGSDIYSSQQALSKNAFLMSNQSKFF